ncbi:hypothetical protein MBBA_2319 [Methanoculleus bourgensis]|nr:hypothetical protein MBBA_2319 [Methanoculleus bourgensis]
MVKGKIKDTMEGNLAMVLCARTNRRSPLAQNSYIFLQNR